MFDDTIIVQTAVSAFNNAALAGPMFFWLGILMIPLFWMVRVCAVEFVERQSILPGLKRPQTRLLNCAMIFWAMVFGWLILMGGHYGVLRDAMSMLSYLMAGALFVATAGLVQTLRLANPALPESIVKRVRRPRLVRYGLLIVAAVVAGLFGAPGWTGFLMAAAAVIAGALVGRATTRGAGGMVGTTLMMMGVVTLMLMQPEFFRFGQLGNLTVIHMLGLVLMAAVAAAVLALRYVNPRGRIHHSAFVKLKWMARILTMLGAALFILTESVPVFLGMWVVMIASCAMSIWHADKIPADLAKKTWGAALGVFGILTIMPVVTAVGILCMVMQSRGGGLRASKFLL